MAKTRACLLIGVEVITVEIETFIGNGFSGLNILGLNSEASRNMRERVRSALESIGVLIPAKRVVVNITPSEKIKESRTPLSQLDFAVAASILFSLYADKLKINYNLNEYFAGELTLSGEIKDLENILIYKALLLNKNEQLRINLSSKNKEIQINKNFIFYFNCLQDWWEFVCGKKQLENNLSNFKPILSASSDIKKNSDNSNFFQEIKNIIINLSTNPKALVGVLVSAMGKHHILFAGEPGIGKTYTLQKIEKLLPPLSAIEEFEIQMIYSKDNTLLRPFRNPHHSVSSAALIGGSSLKPGEVSLAHHGILFLDELSEFSAQSLESLREPLDSKYVCLSRANGHIRYPANFLLCATTNPCSCGYLFSTLKACRCHPKETRKYLQKLSGPLLDRFCLQIWLEPSSSRKVLDCFEKEIISFNNLYKLDKFVENYGRKILQENSYLNDNFSNHIKEILNSNMIFKNLSLRGQEKVRALAYTFHLVFNEIEINSKFIETILNYRILEKMFLQKNLF
ncbi:ATP-binding protein [Pigmentibacter ruber]|uniref:ATP-binding protein n=1 Tax=Pigmentibacter ruber TaxID=2683196 RepID=UPI00131ABB64|nr:ATP-binding protein [Pigmentibacter ruber]BFD31758.1 YifB family Mg chelatase-like AAA ATPase [Pigmentibacter ruber]